MFNLCVDNQAHEIMGDVFCPTCRKKNVFAFQPIKPIVSTSVKSVEPALTLSRA